MKFELQEVDFADGEELAVLQAIALSNSELDKAFHPNLSFDAAIAASKERWLSVYGFLPWEHKKVVDLDNGKIAAFSRWTIDEEYLGFLPPRTGIPEGTVVPPRQRPASLDMDFAVQYGEVSGPISERCIQGRPSMTLDVMVIRPEYRETEAAQLMLEWAAQFADEHSLVCYAESCPQDATIYGTQGFERFDTLKLQNSDRLILLEAFKREPAASATG